MAFEPSLNEEVALSENAPETKEVELVEETKVVPTTNVPFMETTIGKTFKTAAWSATSAFLGGAILWLAGDLTLEMLKALIIIPTLNTFLVTLKSGIDPHVPLR